MARAATRNLCVRMSRGMASVAIDCGLPDCGVPARCCQSATASILCMETPRVCAERSRDEQAHTERGWLGAPVRECGCLQASAETAPLHIHTSRHFF